MNALRLSQLPSVRTNDESGALKMEREGFVDEAAVLAILNGPTHLRTSTYPEDLALAAGDLDFAGWRLPTTAPLVRPTEFPPQVIDAVVHRRATPPNLEEPGIGAPHHGSHRWWLAGMAGAFSTLLFTLLLVTLSSRAHLNPEPARPSKPVPPSQAANAQKAVATPKISPELTGISTHRP